MIFHKAAKNSPLRILVVEDEMLIRWSIVETLGQDGHTVLEADTAAAATAAIKGSTEPIDVVLLDYRLPDSNDFTLLKNIRRMLPSAAIILMTAHGSPDVTRGALEEGACRVMNKPFDMQDVVSAVIDAHGATH